MFLFRLTSVIRSQLAGREFFQIGLRLARLSKVGEAIADLAHVAAARGAVRSRFSSKQRTVVDRRQGVEVQSAVVLNRPLARLRRI